MAYAFANAGLWLGAISYPLLGVLCFFTCVMLVKVVALPFFSLDPHYTKQIYYQIQMHSQIYLEPRHPIMEKIVSFSSPLIQDRIVQSGKSFQIQHSIENPTFIPCLALDPFKTSTIFCGTNSGIYRMQQATAGVHAGINGQPYQFALQQNYPNPFNPSTTIVFELHKGAMVELTVYDVLGNKIKTLLAETKNAGRYAAVWDGSDEHGRSAAGGIYFCRLLCDGFSATRRMIYMK